MNNMQAGANITLNQAQVEAVISWTPTDFPVDIAAFVLHENEKVSSASDFIYLNGSIETQTESISLSLHGGKPLFQIDLTKIAPQVRKIVFTIATQNSFIALQSLSLELENEKKLLI